MADRVLVIDDEKGIREVLEAILTDEGYAVTAAEDGIQGLARLSQEVVDAVILDVWLPNKGGIDVLKEIKETYPGMPVVIISGHGNIDLAVKAVKAGAFDFLEKPLSLEKVLTVVRNAIELAQLKTENRMLKSSMQTELQMLGEGSAMERIREIIRQSAASDSRILISGENGTGKELVAREVHRQSRRAHWPFVEVNCAAIPDTLIESELFGHEKGAFTSAVSQRKGKFELADRGTLFLDEVADMSLPAQSKVLRAVQQMEFERVGGEQTLQVDVRVIAATNKDIRAEIEAGRFREDLYFRLNVIPIHVPPLRERLEDLPLLVEYFMKLHRYPPDGPPRRVTEDGLERMKEYDWPGNIRELKNFVERINIMSDNEEIDAEVIGRHLGGERSQPKGEVLESFRDMGLNEAKESFERRYIEMKLAEQGNNISRTAEALGIYPSNLHGKLRKYGIKVER